MMESLRSATRNTAFERWLATTIKPEGHPTIEPSNPNNAALNASGSHNPAASHAAGSSPSVWETGPAAHAYHSPHSPDSADSTVPESEAGPHVQHGRMLTQSMHNGGRSRNAATAASLDEVAHYLVAGAASAEATADSQPGSMVLAPPVLPAERALPGNLQSCAGGTDADPFRPGWKASILQRVSCQCCVSSYIQIRTHSCYIDVSRKNSLMFSIFRAAGYFQH